jgi:hypothetical protein
LLDICWCLWHLIFCRELLLHFQCKLLGHWLTPCPSKSQWSDSWPM